MKKDDTIMKRFTLILMAGVITAGIATTAFAKSSSLNKKGTEVMADTNSAIRVKSSEEHYILNFPIR